MGTLGVPEMMVIFVLALVLFGPKKLPEIGRTLGKAITEFRKASSELKNTFTAEMENLERETKQIAQTATSNPNESYNYNYDYSSYQAGYETQDQNAIDVTSSENPSTESASATQGAESTLAETPSEEVHAAAPEGAVARGSHPETHDALAPSPETERLLSHETASPSAEHNA
ncbi:MAG TPA: TatA/E family twin arginine-targeting protein translocase [Bryobacteraceae bacterium]|nr:TatA/E family twin arginine-targeting protein translocase [Bryobacteraceae bacterium]